MRGKEVREFKQNVRYNYSGIRWVFTLNNPEMSLADLENSLKENEKVRYFKIAHEKGSKTGTPHFQGYLEFSGAQRQSGVKSAISKRAWPNLSFGTQKAASEYCGKLGKSGDVFGVIEGGEKRKFEQGKRTDIDNANNMLWKIKEEIDNGMSWRELWMRYFPHMVRHCGGLAKYYDIKHPGFINGGRRDGE